LGAADASMRGAAIRIGPTTAGRCALMNGTPRVSAPL
jgi:hypothetical protein